jgi:hypothetical protein
LDGKIWLNFYLGLACLLLVVSHSLKSSMKVREDAPRRDALVRDLNTNRHRRWPASNWWNSNSNSRGASARCFATISEIIFIVQQVEVLGEFPKTGPDFQSVPEDLGVGEVFSRGRNQQFSQLRSKLTFESVFKGSANKLKL